ncbi:MAG: PAS domain S-box protein [Anaerofustis sp.]
MEDSFIHLVYNAALLLSLSVVYELSYLIPTKNKTINSVISGIIIGAIGLAIMSLPFQLMNGVVFDTRSILLSVTAYVFGWLPSAIAGIILIVYRLTMGGSGATAGIAVILISVSIGLLWGKIPYKKNMKLLYFYTMGIAVHTSMLLCMFLLPYETAVFVIQSIAYSVMLLYPAASVILTLLLTRQKERNETLLKIAETKEQYQNFFINNHAMMMLVDPSNGKIVEVNQAAAFFYGYDVDTLRTMSMDQINVLSKEELFQKMQSAKNKQIRYFEFRHKKADGEIADVEVYSGPIRLNGNTLLYSIIHDITDRLKARRELMESEKKFRMLIEQAPEAIYIHSDGIILFANPAAVRMLGAENEHQLIGMPAEKLFISKKVDNLEEYREKLYRQNEPISFRTEQLLRIDGNAIDVEMSAIPINYQDQPSAIVFARDISEKIKMEKSQKELEAQLRNQQKLEAIGTLAGGVAHEINNPLSGIMNYAQLIYDELPTDASSSVYASEIIHETERISEIVRSLLQFSRQEKQSHSYASIYDIINHTILLIQTIIKKDQIELILDIEENLPMIKCRSQQIQQVLMNLLTNARDALNEKYPGYDENKLILLSCRQLEKDGRRWLRIIVEDRGNGIPLELREKIFEPFFSTKPKELGTGLGLSISFGIVQDHHGQITIESELGKYTRFIVDLPVDNGWNLDEKK